MFALIRFTFMFPGLSAPKVSCVTLPIALMGVVSVSPVTRHATSARAKDITTATALCQYGIPNDACASKASATSETSWPAANHDIGVSMASISLGVFDFGENILASSEKARSEMRHFKIKSSRLENTMHAAPGQSVHCTQSRNPACVMSPCCCSHGT